MHIYNYIKYIKMHKINKLHLDLINNFIFEIDFKNIYNFFKYLKKKKL